VSTIQGLRWNCWPDTENRLLLRALLHNDHCVAADTWSTVRRRFDLDAPTVEQFRLYPLLADRLASTVPGEPRMGMLQGVRRHATVQSLLRLRQLDDILSRLEEHDIEAVVLKGPALALTCYEHVGQRPFEDADLLVDPRRHRQAISVLESVGWTQRTKDFRGNHSVALAGGEGVMEVDLHRVLNRELVIAGEPDASWARVRRCAARKELPSGRVIAVLATPDALMHTVVHGTQWEKGPVNLRWVADASRLLADPDLDWDRLSGLSATFGVSAVVHDALCFVAQTTGISVPQEVLARLRSERVSPFERWRTAAFHRRPRTDGLAGGLPLTLAVLLRRTRDRPASGVLRAAPGFLCEAWELERPRQLPIAIARRAFGSATMSRQRHADVESRAKEIRT
jgi:hypothetical protein